MMEYVQILGNEIYKILFLLVPILVSVAMIVWLDRRVWGLVQKRKGPNVVGPFGLLQTLADALKYIFKEIIIPASANKVVFILAPIVTMTLALVAWAVIPISEELVLSDINVGVLYLFAVSSLGVYGIIMGGWASNSKYPFLGAIRSAAQMVSYEVSIGSFEGAIQPETTNFREFPEWAETEGSKLPKDKKIAMFCTGGIRCEKASSFLKDKGFEKVYHLKGGILNYLEKVKPEESLWNGECFVFDDRVALNHKLEPGSYDLCHGCRMPITEDDKLSPNFIRGVSCSHCFNDKTEEQKRRYADRQMQIDLAKSRNQKHIGSKREVEQK